MYKQNSQTIQGVEGARTLREILVEKWGFQQFIVGVDIELRIKSA